jgi:toxin YhaV
MLKVKGWTIGAHPLFVDQLTRVIEAVDRERRKDPDGYRNGANAKLLASIVKLIGDVIPERPDSPAFRQGDTLGRGRQHWLRAKFAAGRFRLFFRYSSKAKAIIYAWVNDRETLRTYDSRTDAYYVFRKMLAAGNPPDDWETLLAVAASPEAMDRLAEALRAAKELGSTATPPK